jgi:hypothetical protein
VAAGSAGTGHLTVNGRLGRAGTNHEPFRILELARFDFVVRRMKEETSVPHSRLACNHLHLSLPKNIGR